MRYEDGLYRFYHQSHKVHRLQAVHARDGGGVALARPPSASCTFAEILAAGTGIEFVPEHNDRWTEVTRPIVEAFLHAKHFLEIAVKCGGALEAPPRIMPSGWAALLHFYGLR